MHSAWIIKAVMFVNVTTGIKGMEWTVQSYRVSFLVFKLYEFCFNYPDSVLVLYDRSKALVTNTRGEVNHPQWSNVGQVSSRGWCGVVFRNDIYIFGQVLSKYPLFFWHGVNNVVKSEKVILAGIMHIRLPKLPTAECRELARWAIDFTEERVSPRKRTLVFASTKMKNDFVVVVPIHLVTSSQSNLAIMTIFYLDGCRQLKVKII